MEMEGGLILVQHPVKGPEAGMGQVGAGHHVLARRMGQQNIKSLFKIQLWGQPYGPQIHLPVGVLMGALLIAHGAPQAYDTQALILIVLPVDTGAAQRRVLFIVPVVVAMDIEHRAVGKGSQKGQVMGFQVPAGEDQVHPLQLIRRKIVPEGGGLVVGHSQNLHFSPASSKPWTLIHSLA